MRVLITGGTGQLGRALAQTAPAGTKLVSCGSRELDIRNREAVEELVAGCRPELVINAAAFTAVDRAEEEPEAAFGINGHGAGHVAEAASQAQARLVHLSTDFVFDGRRSVPYQPGDKPNPLSVYGASKLEGERLAAAMGGRRTVVVRTAWVYAAQGKNFVRTMLNLLAEKERLTVVADQVGTPTWARGLAEAVWQIARTEYTGTLHWTDAGVASWYDLAVAVQEEALGLGLLHRQIPILPIRTVDFPTPARRPAYSVLDKTATWELLGHPAPHWRSQLRRMLKEVLSAEELRDANGRDYSF